MKKKSPLAITLISIVLLSFTAGEDDVLQRIIAGFKKYIQERPQEKVYLHFDRPQYTNRDTIWFKAYLTAGEAHEPSSLSNTIYVELINGSGKLIRQVRLLADSGSAAGDIALSDSLASGNYLVRAYTNWMKNSDEDYFFHHLIKVWNKGQAEANLDAQEKNLAIQFFPEGGELVNGIQSRVAFKAIGEDGLGREVKGNVVDESSKTICEFKSNYLGMGSFYFTPQIGKSYHAVIENDGTEIKLPEAKNSGLVMSVKNVARSSDITVWVQSSENLGLSAIRILGQTRGLLSFAATATFSARHIAFVKIPKAKFPGGVAQITVTDLEGNPLAERLTFLEEKPLLVKITSDKDAYSPRELVKVQIQVTDSAAVPVIANMSMAVCDDASVPPDNNRENINSYLLLSSELRGYIQSPGYYFNLENADRESALDVLLLTQGWRRFTIQKALQTNWPEPRYKVERGLTFKGRMVDYYNNKPIANGKVSYVTTIPFDMRTEQTDASGAFELNELVYFDSTRIMLQGETKKGNKWTKFLFDPYDFPATQFPIFGFSPTPSVVEKSFIIRSLEKRQIDNQLNAIQLKEVEIKSTKLEPEYKTGSLYGVGSRTVKVKDSETATMTHPLQLLQGRMAGVMVSGAGSSWQVQVRGLTSISANSSTANQPIFLVDDSPVPIDFLNSINVKSIESYTVWMGNTASIFGSQGANGVIGFYTKKGGNMFQKATEGGNYTVKRPGYQTEREFYAPRYDVKKSTDEAPDKRITLHWAPHVKTDAAGKAEVSFYNHDVATSVTGILEGVSKTGKPVVATFSYDIRRN